MNHTNYMTAQSGGPTAAINASLAGILSGARKNGRTCFGAINGILGLLHKRYLNLSETVPDDETLSRLRVTPAMYLGSCRHKLPDFREDPSDYEAIFEEFRQKDIGAFFYIGGNDSMDTVLKLSAYAAHIGSDVRIIGVPKTIDNDLCGIDHTPGFGSAAKYIASSMLEIAHDTFIYAVKSVTIVEIMGRDAGWLTAASALARNGYNSAPHLIYLPETPFSTEQFLSDVREALRTRNNVIVAVSEGIRDKDGAYIAAAQAANDGFGHRQLSGAGKALEYLVQEHIGVKVRSVEINVLQRCAAHLASATDLSESFALGENAAALAESGMTAVMSALTRTGDDPYAVTYGHTPIAEAANNTRPVPRAWINESGNDITPELVSYLKPLILGESAVSYEDGIPVYMPATHLKPDF